jgi:HD superfamily phosphohydrolase
VAKHIHEIRDPIHVFVHVTNEERRLIDSRFFQRLRHIQQLSLTSLVYPSATHTRFEHSLGVMELASRAFDVLMSNLTDEVRNAVSLPGNLDYWKGVLRLAALCHDLGHLPFSHSAEGELLPEGWDHERLTAQLVLSPEMKEEVWDKLDTPVRPEDVAKLALGPKKAKTLGQDLTTWEAILSEIITGDAFGVDRMDYLLRDSHHAGVPYGRFDQYRLVDSLRVLRMPAGETDEQPDPALGLDVGGMHIAEAMLLARFFMFSQLYFHPVRRIYDIHLRDFLSAWLEGGRFPTNVQGLLEFTDHEVTAAMREAARDAGAAGHEPARRIVTHDHFKLLYTRQPDDIEVNPEATKAVYEAAQAKFGTDNVRYDGYLGKGGALSFPVRMMDGRVVHSTAASDILRMIPAASYEYVFIEPSLRAKGLDWLEKNRSDIIRPGKEQEQ